MSNIFKRDTISSDWKVWVYPMGTDWGKIVFATTIKKADEIISMFPSENWKLWIVWEEVFVQKIGNYRVEILPFVMKWSGSDNIKKLEKLHKDSTN